MEAEHRGTDARAAAPHTPLAFAARLSPNTAGGATDAGPTQEAPAAVADSAARSTPQPAGQPLDALAEVPGAVRERREAAPLPAGPQDLPGDARALFAVPPAPREVAPQPSVKPEAKPAPPLEPAAEADRAPAPRADAVRDVSLRVNPAGQERVEVRLVERDGEVRVAVHAADADLRRGLNAGLTDLMGLLEGSGYRAETWRPPEAGFEQQHSSGQRQAPQDGSAGEQGHGRRHQQHSQSRPEWIDEMENGFRAAGSDSERSISWLPQSLR